MDNAAASLRGTRLSGPIWLVMCLLPLSALMVFATLVIVAVLIITAAALPPEQRLGWQEVFFWAAVAGACTVVAAWSWALSWIIRRQYDGNMLQRRLLSELGRLSAQMEGLKTSVNAPAGAQADTDLMQRVLAELGEINANLLLSDQQRDIKRRSLQLELSGTLAARVEDLLQQGQVDQAQDVLDRLLAEVPDTPHREKLVDRVSMARTAARKADIESQAQKIKDLMAASSFEPARRAAQALVAKYADSKEARQLAQQVQREETAFETEKKKRMYMEIGAHAEARRWRPALAAAKQFIEAFPKGADADLVRAQLQTLNDNAQIEEVRQMRDSIRDMITRRRFVEAFDLARDLVDRFPHTAAAEELRQQMDKFSQRAKEEMKK